MNKNSILLKLTYILLGRERLSFPSSWTNSLESGLLFFLVDSRVLSNSDTKSDAGPQNSYDRYRREKYPEKKNPSFNNAFSLLHAERRQIPPTYLTHTSGCDDGFEKVKVKQSK